MRLSCAGHALGSRRTGPRAVRNSERMPPSPPLSAQKATPRPCPPQRLGACSPHPSTARAVGQPPGPGLRGHTAESRPHRGLYPRRPAPPAGPIARLGQGGQEQTGAGTARDKRDPQESGAGPGLAPERQGAGGLRRTWLQGQRGAQAGRQEPLIPGGGRNGKTSPDRAGGRVASPWRPPGTSAQKKGLRASLRPGPTPGAQSCPLVTCSLVLETHVSSSSSRRERWKARVVLTAMKTSCSRSSRDRGLGGLSLGVSCTPCGDRLEWYRRERSPMHRRVKRAPARPRRRRHCIGPGTPDSSAPESLPDREARLVRRGPQPRQKSGRHEGQVRRGEVGTSALAPEAKPRQPRRRHRPSPPAPYELPPGSGTPGPAPASPRSPRGGAGPGEPQRWPEKAPLKGQPQPRPPASCCNGGGDNTKPSVPHGREGPSSLPTPQRLSLSSFNTHCFLVSCSPASQLLLTLYLLLDALPHPPHCHPCSFHPASYFLDVKAQLKGPCL